MRPVRLALSLAAVCARAGRIFVRCCSHTPTSPATDPRIKACPVLRGYASSRVGDRWMSTAAKAALLETTALSPFRGLGSMWNTGRFNMHSFKSRDPVGRVSQSILVFLVILLAAMVQSAAAQTAQLIVTGPPGLGGSYAAVTYDQAPSNVTRPRRFRRGISTSL
jgi:hypothetical protein